MATSSPALQHALAYALDAEHIPVRSRQLVPDQPHLMIAVDSFFSESECSALIAAAHASGLQPPSAADLTPRKNEAFLNRESSAFIDISFAQRVWRRLLPYLPEIDGRVPVGLHGDNNKCASCMLKFYRYTKGMRFDQHVDQSWKGAAPGEETEYTLLFYLNSSGEPLPEHGCDQPLQGGDTVFMRTAKSELCRVQPKRGMALLHAHGRRCLMHYGEEVTRGEKYVLRADVMYRRLNAAHSLPVPTAAAGSPAAATECESARKGPKKKKGR